MGPLQGKCTPVPGAIMAARALLEARSNSTNSKQQRLRAVLRAALDLGSEGDWSSARVLELVTASGEILRAQVLPLIRMSLAARRSLAPGLFSTAFGEERANMSIMPKTS